MKTKVLILSLIPLLLTSCGGDNNYVSVEVKDESYYYELESVVAKDENNNAVVTPYIYRYKTPTFNKPNDEFDRELALLSFLSINTTYIADNVADFYTDLGFDNFFYSKEYTQEEELHSVKHFIAHKRMYDYDVVALSLNGRSYNKPWGSNFILGESGNSLGFQEGANLVFASLNEYLKDYDMETTKIWLTGYSRGAAVANILSYTLLDEKIVKEGNLYAYLYETPSGIDINNAPNEYNCVFNLFSSPDPIIRVPFKEYGFKRIGVDIDIFDANLSTIVKDFEPKIVLDEFMPREGKYTNENELVQYLFNGLIAPKEDGIDASTRANYVKYYQSSFAYVFGLIFSMKETTLGQIMTQINSLSAFEKIALIGKDGMYDLMKPILDKNNEPYNDEELRTSLNTLIKFIASNTVIVSSLLVNGFVSNLKRCFFTHAPEIILPLLLNKYFK